MENPRIQWHSRIVGYGEERPSALMANPYNWREHGPHQRKVLEALLDQIGWVKHVVVNQPTGHIVDGHLRVQLAQARDEECVPVIYVDVSEEEERLILASLDPIATLAATDTAQLMSLVSHVDPESKEVATMIRDLAGLADQRPHTASQQQIETRQQEMLTQFENRPQATFECQCPDCGHEFSFAR